MKEKSCSKLYEEQTIRKVAESLDIYLTAPDEIQKYAKMVQSNSSDNFVHRYNFEILNLFNPEIQLIKTTPISKKIKRIIK